MQKASIGITRPDGPDLILPHYHVHTLVVGSGAAGLGAAVQLHARGLDDVLVVTEGLDMGTSINTGSDKQTYYKLGMYGPEPDSPVAMAETYFAGGGMHGDLALVEAGLSARAFMHLVELGVPFPTDRYGQFVGYKTDHDPRRRATSVGPYTSREMCRALIRELRRAGLPVHENRVVVALLTVNTEAGKRAAGAVAVDLRAHVDEPERSLAVYTAENVIFAAGGPGGLYRASVYPACHTGGIGLALIAGARAQNLPEFQHGLASTAFRWNVSGTFMQVLPRFVSTDADGRSDGQEFLRPYFGSAGGMNSMVFLKGYQWPFDARKLPGGSSLIDILVYCETVLKGRRVFLDYRSDPDDFSFADLSDEAREYLERSDALLRSPMARLEKMNPGAVELYREHGIDLAREPLEIAVCAQHNNGGLAGTIWWESPNLKHLFPVGEINGSHGIYRPGGSALNAGQVGAIRAAEYIAHRYEGMTLDPEAASAAARDAVMEILAWLQPRSKEPLWSWQEERAALQARMTADGAHIRRLGDLQSAATEAWKQYRRLASRRGPCKGSKDLAESLTTRQLCFSQAVYFEAMAFAVSSGVGSRGSSMVVDTKGTLVHPMLGGDWRFAPEDESFRGKVLETQMAEGGRFRHTWVDRRPIPLADAWFETAWAAFRNGSIYE